jgi:hypothetical protein
MAVGAELVEHQSTITGNFELRPLGGSTSLGGPQGALDTRLGCCWL